MAEETENTENTENPDEQVEETPAAPESVEETPVEAEAPVEDAVAEEPVAEELAAEGPPRVTEQDLTLIGFRIPLPKSGLRKLAYNGRPLQRVLQFRRRCRVVGMCRE